MTAHELRSAAAHLRSLAEAAMPGEWRADGTLVLSHSDIWFGAKYVADCYEEPDASEADAALIAAMGPTFALAVADLIDTEAEHVASYDCEAHCEPDGCEQVRTALAVARSLTPEAAV